MNRIFRSPRVLIMTAMMIVITIMIASITLLLIYNNARKDLYSRLADIVKLEKATITVLAVDNLDDIPHIITHLERMDEHDFNIGETGEVYYARIVGDSIELFTSEFASHKKTVRISKHIPSTSPLAMALRGASGTIKGIDYTGRKVFAAYSNVKILGWAVVAEIPVQEFRRPYIQSGFLVVILAFLLVTTCSYLFIKITNPMLDELVEHENKLVHANEQLVQNNRLLKEAKEKAEQSDSLKTAFLQNISHEVRTPLNAITGFASLLDMPDLSQEKQKKYSSIINNSSKQLLSIVTDILTISSLHTNQEQLHETKMNVKLLLDELYEIFKIQSDEKQLELRLNYVIDEEEAIILADETKLHQILSNLLSNAIKFTSSGSVEIGCYIKSGDLQFYVKDTGIGIPEGMYNNIFERFRQADLAINKHYGGTGLGLSIAQGFAELMGGRIWVDSQQQKGSLFYVSIPYKQFRS